MARKTAKPELEWQTATIEQVADLRVWVSARRVPQRHVQGICEWLFTLSEPKAPSPSKRHRELYRRLLGAYGPPRQAAAGINVDRAHTDVAKRLAEIAERNRAGIRPVDDPPQAVSPLRPEQPSGGPELHDASGAGQATEGHFHRA